ncbi:MAG: hypothetical protein M1378_11645 [Bacteroidetes bacterium]|nr:hypothetical protein [Bacteroidota bacterium]
MLVIPTNWLKRFIAGGKAEREIDYMMEFEPRKYRALERQVRRGYPAPQSESDAIWWKTFSEYSGIPLPKGYGYKSAAASNTR